MFDVGFVIAFWGGVVSFFAPCVFPLIPGYVSYISGVTYKELYGDPEKFRTRVMVSVIGFVIGFSLIFVMLGATAGGFGFLLRRHLGFLTRVGGVVILLSGLSFAGVINWNAFGFGSGQKIDKWLLKAGYLRSVLIGATFGLSWTPCIGAVLGSILTLAASTQTATKGALLLFVYGLGITIPFIFIALMVATLPSRVKSFNKYLPAITRVSGLLLVVVGILLLTDTYNYVNGLIWEIIYSKGAMRLW